MALYVISCLYVIKSCICSWFNIWQFFAPFHKQLIKLNSHAQFNVKLSVARVEIWTQLRPPCEGTLSSNPWFSLMRKHVLYHQCNWSAHHSSFVATLENIYSHMGQKKIVQYPTFLEIFHRFISEQNWDILYLFYVKS